MTDLSIRIADALKKALPSSEIAAILEEAMAADGAARDSYTQAEAVALDPLTEPNQVAAARKAMDDAKFNMDRLANGVAALNKRFEEVLQAEQEAARQAKLDAAEKRQKAAAARLRDRYPELAQEIADILAECKAADRSVQHAGGRTRSTILAGYLPNGIKGRDSDPLTFTRLAAPLAAFPTCRGMFWPIR